MNISGNIKQLKIYNLQGKLVKSFTSQESYSIAELPVGLYFVQMKNEFGQSTRKIVKQ